MGRAKTGEAISAKRRTPKSWLGWTHPPFTAADNFDAYAEALDGTTYRLYTLGRSETRTAS